jgi:cytochrome c oxidase assembly factor CtaG
MSQPVLHSSTSGSFLTSWAPDPLLINLLALAALAYALGLRAAARRGRRRPARGRIAAFYGGLAATAVALLGPLDTWNDELFFIHMLQHLVLMIIAAPLLLLGRPVQVALQALPPARSGALIGTLFRRDGPRQAATLLAHPLTVFTLYNLNLALWHLPRMYVAALESELVHELEHLAFFGTALLFWWVIIDPVPRHHRASAHWQFWMCFGTCMIGGLVAAALTLANRVLYPFYLDAGRPWGLSAQADQQLGGGIMWISGALYFVLMFAMLVRMVSPGASAPNRTAGSAHSRHLDQPSI